MNGSFSPTGKYIANGEDNIDPRLQDILHRAAIYGGHKVNAVSGYRPGDPGYHGEGLATDVQLMHPETGKPLPNYQNAETFPYYEKYAQDARAVQQKLYPELDKKFRWGGYFSGPPGKYGATDLMHFDLGGSDKLGMAGGSWDTGLTPLQAKLIGSGVQSTGMIGNAYASPSGTPAPAMNAINGALPPKQPGAAPAPPVQNDARAPLLMRALFGESTPAPQQPAGGGLAGAINRVGTPFDGKGVLGGLLNLIGGGANKDATPVAQTADGLPPLPYKPDGYEPGKGEENNINRIGAGSLWQRPSQPTSPEAPSGPALYSANPPAADASFASPVPQGQSGIQGGLSLPDLLSSLFRPA